MTASLPERDWAMSEEKSSFPHRPRGHGKRLGISLSRCNAVGLRERVRKSPDNSRAIVWTGEGYRAVSKRAKSQHKAREAAQKYADTHGVPCRYEDGRRAVGIAWPREIKP
jgi:hypothetical protein